MRGKKARVWLGMVGVLFCVSSHGEQAWFANETGGSLLARVQALYSQGHMPEFTDFPAGKAIPAKTIYANAPDITDSTVQLVSITTGDTVLGPLYYGGIFLGGVTFDEAQETFLGKDPTVVMDPLTAVKSQDAILSVGHGLGTICGFATWFRKVSLPSAPRVLVYEAVANDTSPKCNPNALGLNNGQLISVGYVILP